MIYKINCEYVTIQKTVFGLFILRQVNTFLNFYKFSACFLPTLILLSVSFLHVYCLY